MANKVAMNWSDIFGTQDVQERCSIDGCNHWSSPAYHYNKVFAYFKVCGTHLELKKEEYRQNNPTNKLDARSAPRFAICKAHNCQERIIRKFSERQLCDTHLREYELNKKILLKCSVFNCSESRVGIDKLKAGLCDKHRVLRIKQLEPIPKSRIQQKCIVESCENLQDKKGKIGNFIYFRRYCAKHHRSLHCTEKLPTQRKKHKKLNIDTTLCSLCKWEGPCDKHRIVAGQFGGRYEKGNVISVCPNCHRLIHRGIKQTQTSQQAII